MLDLAHPRFAIAAAAALMLLSLPRTGWCTERDSQLVSTTTDANGYGYRFTDDLVAGSGLSVTDPRIHVLRHVTRDLLIRPRLAFIPELLKSVENL